MGKVTRKIAAIAVGGALALGMASAAVATVTNVDGGTWDYGTNGDIVWSYYLHYSQYHRTTVYDGSYHYSPCTSPGYWARVTGNDRWLAVDESYYAFC